jgi:PadR family transcriptional regulator AphA
MDAPCGQADARRDRRHAVRTTRTELTLTEWVVLGLVAEAPTHGWAIVRTLKPGGAIGEVWTSSLPVVYRAIRLLVERGLIQESGAREGHGPERILVAITPNGSAALAAWLDQPVAHVRDLRSEFLIKLLLRERHGLDTSSLVRHQIAQIRPIAKALRYDVTEATGSGRAIALWRSTAAQAALRFLAALEREAAGAGARPRESTLPG